VPPGPAGVKLIIQGYKSAFPDLHVTVDQQLAEGDLVTTRWTATGTHQGELMGVAPTGKQATVTGILIDRFEGDRIAESWEVWDALGLMQQLGAVATPAAATV
jgi:predicted ester cyclase